MENTNTSLVIGENGLRGHLLTASLNDVAAESPVIVDLDNGQKMHVPANMLVRQQNGTYYLPIGAGDIPAAHVSRGANAACEETALVVPVYQEELSVDKRTVEIGSARITKHVEQRESVVDEPLLRQEVQIDHVPINQMWEGPPPPPRYEADKLIVPLLEEVLVVEKRLMLKEELHISRVQRTVREPQKVMLRSEHVTVERVEPASDNEASRTFHS
jgi:uncharacterized protein (TIGR02271 family)